MPDPLLTASDVAALCQVSPKTIMRAIKSGHLRAARLGKRGAFRISPEDVETWLDRISVKPPEVADPRVARRLAGRVLEPGRLHLPEQMGDR